jgi:hypothetical protein
MASIHRWGHWEWDMRCGIAVGPLRAARLPLQIVETSKACHRDTHTPVASRLLPLKTHIVLVLPHRAARVHSLPRLPPAFHIQATRIYRPLLTQPLRYRRLHRECWSRTQTLWKLTFRVVGIEVAVVPRMSGRRNQLSLHQPHPLGVHRFRMERR